MLKHGAEGFGIMEDAQLVQIAFRMNGRNILFRVPLPDTAQKQRARWRCLLLSIKSKLESTVAGIETFEEAFLAQTVMPSGQTVGETALPAIAQHYDGATDVPLLPNPRPKSQ